MYQDDEKADVDFIKGLLIGLCTIDGIKKSTTFAEGILDFIKGKKALKQTIWKYFCDTSIFFRFVSVSCIKEQFQ